MECNICNKEVTDGQNWRWGDEPAHKLCVIDEANVVCDEMCCFDVDNGNNTDEENECECGSTLKPITDREKKALFV